MSDTHSQSIPLQPPLPWESEGEAMTSSLSCKVSAALVEEGFCTDLHWYAINTRSRHEKMVRDRLTGMGIEPFLPLMREMRQWSDRKVWTESPLFAGYCFARFLLTSRLTVLQTPGILSIVGSVAPEVIPDGELLAIKTLIQSKRPFESHDYFTQGTWVEVVQGPLAGLRGQLVRKAKRDCLVVSVRLIQQAAIVHINMSEVQPVDSDAQ